MGSCKEGTTVRPENLILLLLLGGLLFLMFSRTRRQQREVQQTQASLTVGVEVMTASGMFATVVELDDQAVVLETGPGQRSRWDRRAVARVIGPKDAVGGAAATSLGTDADDESAGARLEHNEGPGEAGPSAPPDRS